MNHDTHSENRNGAKKVIGWVTETRYFPTHFLESGTQMLTYVRKTEYSGRSSSLQPSQNCEGVYGGFSSSPVRWGL